MAKGWTIRLRPEDAAQPLRAMPPVPRKRMNAALAALGTDPTGTSNGLDVRRLEAEGSAAVFRLRIGDWRAGFLIRGRTIDVVRIFHRSEGYAWLDRLHP